jgi:putative ABC transport system permease protein
MKRGFFLFFSKSIAQRKGRFVIASLSVMIAVAVVTSMIGVTVGIKEKLGAELRAYGANIIVSHKKGEHLDYAMLNDISELDHVRAVSGQIFGSTVIRDQSIEVIGLDIAGLQERGWRLYGNLPQTNRQTLAGITLKEALGLEERGSIRLRKGGGPQSETSGTSFMPLIVTGFIEKGGMEDRAFIMSLQDAWELMNVEETLSAVLVSGESGHLIELIKNIENLIPQAQVKTLRQVASAEASLLAKMQLLMILVTLVVLFAAVVSIASTMGANVLERREELGLMMAIGATRGEISMFYKAEALLIGLTGGMTGFVFGYISAQAISRGAFESYISMPPSLPLLSLAAGVLISLSASHFPVRDAIREKPALILRGE